MENKILEFLHNRLYPDQIRLETEKSGLEAKIKSYYELKQFAYLRQTSVGVKVQGQVKIGCEFFMQAEGIADYISVETGVPGLYIDLTPIEALEYIAKKENLLLGKLQLCNKYLEEVKMHINTINTSVRSLGDVEIQEPLA